MIRTPSLHVVTPDEPAPAKASVAAQVRLLQSQIAELSDAQVGDLLAAIARACELAAEVAENRAQAPGIRDLARRMIEDEEPRAETIRAIAARTS